MAEATWLYACTGRKKHADRADALGREARQLATDLRRLARLRKQFGDTGAL